jgi:predicted anti-sigma-YlaC factor YlaD
MRTDLHQSMRHLIDRSLAGELSSTEHHSLRDHLHECAACQKYADDTRRVIAGLGGFAFTANADLQTKVFAALAQRAQQLEVAQHRRRRIVRTCIAALLLTIVGSLAALHLGDPLAGLLHLEPAKTQAGVLALWVLPSLCFCLFLPALLLLPARSMNKKGSAL